MARMAVEEEVPPGAPEWIVTFSDLTSLLVTFFVMLMSFSSFDESQRQVMTIKGLSMLGKPGAIQTLEARDLVASPREDRLLAVDALNGSRQQHLRPQSELLANLAEMGQAAQPGQAEVDFNVRRDGLRLGFGADASFEPGSCEVSLVLAERLAEVARVAQHYPNLIVVEGFTDAHFRPTPTYPTAESLSLARAGAAADVLLRESELSPLMVQIAGLGAHAPVNPEDSATARSENRRVELRIVSLSQARELEVALAAGGGR